MRAITSAPDSTFSISAPTSDRSRCGLRCGGLEARSAATSRTLAPSRFLKRNTAGHAAITCHNAALFPGAKAREPFFSRYDGDGEAGLASYATDTFRAGAVKPAFEVDVVDPVRIASADIVKIDIEGGEADVLDHLDLSATSLVLLEFQHARNRARMQSRLEAANFESVIDEACPWDPILDYLDYRADLKGDVYGRMFYRRRGQTRLRYTPA